MEVIINVDGQTMRPRSVRKFVAGSKNFADFLFNLSDDWDGLTVFAQFRQDEQVFTEYLDSSDKVSLPYDLSDGDFTLALCGVGGSRIGVTHPLKLRLLENKILI